MLPVFLLLLLSGIPLGSALCDVIETETETETET